MMEAVVEPYVLSPRQRAVLQHIAHGLTSKQIARLLGISQHTVEIHRTAAIHRLGATSSSHAVFIACQEGMLG